MIRSNGACIGIMVRIAVLILAVMSVSPMSSDTTLIGPGDAVAESKSSDPATPVLFDATDARFTDLERSAAKCVTSGDALLQYQTFRHTHRIPSSLRLRYDDEYNVWKDRSAKKLIKMGPAWMPFDSAQTVAAETDKLIEEAFESIGSENYKRARDLLVKASHRDTGGVRADFILGLLNTPLAANHCPSAHQHFLEVLNRCPQHVSALNNLALIEVRMRRHDTALIRWEAALTLSPACEEILHNLQRYLDESRAGTISATPGQVKRVATLLGNQSEDPKRGRGWLYMPLILPVQETRRTTLAKSAMRIGTSQGVGIVVAPQTILTTWHSVKDAEELVVARTEDGAQHGQMIASNPELDIALVRVGGLTAPPLKLAKAFSAGDASSFRIFPVEPARSQNSPRTVPGDLFKISEDKQYLYLTANLPPGEGGGPVFDSSGNVVALHLGHLKLESGAISVGLLIEPVLRHFKDELSAVPTETRSKKLSSSELSQLASASTIPFRCYKTAYASSIGHSNVRRLDDLNDTSCSACAGSGRTACIARGCNEGIATVKVSYQEAHGIGSGKHMITRFKTVKVKCQKCGGDGAIPCPYCRGRGKSSRPQSGVPRKK